jgi:hypothetical protein
VAQKLIEQWHLSVLSAGIDLTGQTPAVAAELFSYQDGRPVVLWRRHDPIEEYGIGGAGPPATMLPVPPPVVAAVTGSMDTVLAGQSSLWLRLIPPYGFLGTVAWEDSLLPGRPIPVLRVPDRLPVASDPGRVWSAVIAVSAPIGSTWAAPYVESLLRSLESQLPLARDVHVFADRATANTLRERRTGEVPWVHLHEPQDAHDVSADRSRRGVSQFRRQASDVRVVGPPPAGQVWADWIAVGVAGRAIRTLHLVLDANWDQDRPVLAVSPDPNKPVDNTRCAYVTGDDVRLLADVLGASTLSLGSPPSNRADAASRMLVDDIGRQRSGPTLYTSLTRDGDGRHIAEMYGFLAAAPGDRPLPWHPSLFAYLQPEHVQGRLRDAWPEPAEPSDDPSAFDPLGATVLPEAYQVTPEVDLSTYYATQQSVPSWVGTSERYVATELASMSRPADAPTTTSTYKVAYDEGKAEALSQIQEIIARHVSPT